MMLTKEYVRKTIPAVELRFIYQLTMARWFSYMILGKGKYNFLKLNLNHRPLNLFNNPCKNFIFQKFSNSLYKIGKLKELN